ncbi:hypothetical protein Bbelb_023090 [Branchiostoma belcheri]|nr:hypothetical protein Bbelb_023090 [Branchiostoma belcheri]
MAAAHLHEVETRSDQSENKTRSSTKDQRYNFNKASSEIPAEKWENIWSETIYATVDLQSGYGEIPRNPHHKADQTWGETKHASRAPMLIQTVTTCWEVYIASMASERGSQTDALVDKQPLVNENSTQTCQLTVIRYKYLRFFAFALYGGGERVVGGARPGPHVPKARLYTHGVILYSGVICSSADGKHAFLSNVRQLKALGLAMEASGFQRPREISKGSSARGGGKPGLGFIWTAEDGQMSGPKATLISSVNVEWSGDKTVFLHPDKRGGYKHKCHTRASHLPGADDRY